MENINYKLRYAKKFSDNEIATFKKIVLSKGEVSAETFDGLILKNPILLFSPNTSDVEAVGALKVPHESYKDKVFKNSKSELAADDFQYELGWVVSLKPGLGKIVTEILAKKDVTVYATVREGNAQMLHIIQKYGGFKQSGIPYQSDRGDYKNILFIKRNEIIIYAD